jgi:hypothetical protein
MSRCSLSLLLLLSLSGCAFVTPRFPQNVQASFVKDDMRKLTTRSMELYYPEHLRPAALRIAARTEACAERLRQLAQSKRERERLLVYLTSSDFNNAYVSSAYLGNPQQMVMPYRMTLEFFNLLGFGPAELGGIGCHEAVHYVQMQQVEGLWDFLNSALGSVLQPNIFTESWFLEGLATWYEGRLDGEQGRPHSPVWRGSYSALLQARQARLHAGYLSVQQREMAPWGGNYLTGSHFVEWLAQAYGEDKLWKLVALQADSILSPLGVSLRFERVYGRSLDDLFDQYMRTLQRQRQERTRPAEQQVLEAEVGLFARLAVSPKDGAIATLGERRDEPVRLVVREADGRVRFRRSLLEPLPGRRWIAFSPLLMSGLSFSASGDFLYLVGADVAEDGSYTARLWKVDARTGEVVRLGEGVEGLGGGITPDERGYVYVRVQGDTSNLMRLDLERGTEEPLTAFQDRRSLGAPAVSPEGSRIVFSLRTERGWNLALRESTGSVRMLTEDDHFNYSPRWVDDDRLVFLREHEGRWQAHLLTLSSGELVRVTDVPHLAMDVAPLGQEHLVFLNREGADFSLDKAPLRPLAEPAPALVAAPAEQPKPGEPPPLPEYSLEVLSDTPYSPLEGFFLPVLRTPYVFALPAADSRLGVYAGASLSGQDRLGLHQYALTAQYDTLTQDPSLSLSYANSQLAPWYLGVSATRRVTLVPGTENRPEQRWRDVQGEIYAVRDFWATPVSVGLLALRRDYYATEGRPGLSTSLLGPQASISWAGGEGSAYGGTQLGLAMSLSGGLYPGAFGSTNTLGEVRAQVQAFLPGLPLLTRDNLQIGLVGRFLPGAPEGLLQVGGVQLGTALLQSPEPSPNGYGLPRNLQPGTAFFEFLRGYEDYPLGARNVVVGSANYRYRFIIDRGWASTLYVGPSLFISQLDLDVFGSWARTDLRADHRAVGASLTLRTTFGIGVPLGIYYQYAYRLDDNLGALHLVGLSN